MLTDSSAGSVDFTSKVSWAFWQQVDFERRPLILLPLAKQLMGRAVSGVADREFPQRRREFQNRYGRSLTSFPSLSQRSAL